MKDEIKKRIELIEKGQVPEGYKKTKVGIIPEDWKVYKIEECLRRVANPVEVEKDREYVQIGIKSHGKGVFYKDPVLGSSLGNKKVYWIEPNCLVLNIVFAWEQAVGVTTQAEDGFIGSHRFLMYESINETCLVEYVKYYFLTKEGKNILEAASPGGAGRNRTLGQERFMKSYVALPSVMEQRKIVSILEIMTRNVDITERLLIQKIKQKEWLTKNLLTGKKRLNSFQGEWKKVKLSDVLKERKEYSRKGQGYKHVTLSKDGIFEKNERYDREHLVKTEDKKYKVTHQNDICYNPANLKFGVICKNDFGDAIFSPIYVTFEVKKEYHIEFVSQYLMWNEFIKTVRKYEEGTVYERMAVNSKDFVKIEIALPPLPEQQAIAQVLNQADKEIQLLQQKLDLMKQEKKAVMQLLLTGIVRVS